MYFIGWIRSYTQNYIPAYGQNVPPSILEEPIDGISFSAKQKLIPFFLKQAFNFKNHDDQRFYFVLADSGMGKTAFMINLFLKYKFWSNPLLRKFDIKLIPFGSPKMIERIESIQNKENTILLLDAFDEDIEAVRDHKKRLNEIIGVIYPFREVIITCRSQFFPTQEEEPEETGILKFGLKKGQHTFKKIYISPFDDENIKTYLGNKYKFYEIEKRKKAFKIVKSAPNLMVRPLLLSFMDDMIDVESNFKYPTKIYQYLINKWMEREASRIVSVNKQATKIAQEIYIKKLFSLSIDVAWQMYKNISQKREASLTKEEFESISSKYIDVQTSDIELRSRSLLNRTFDGKIKFAHRSIMEYFIAYKINGDLEKELVNYEEFVRKGINKFIAIFLEKYMIHNFIENKNDIIIFSNKIIKICMDDLKLNRNNFKDEISKLVLIINKLAFNSSIDFKSINTNIHINTLDQLSSVAEDFFKIECYKYFEANGGYNLYPLVEKFISELLSSLQNEFLSGSNDLTTLDMAKFFINDLLDINNEKSR